MRQGQFTPRARRELRNAVIWITEDNPDAAEALVRAAIRAADMVAANPALARFRFWSLRGYPYLPVFDVDRTPPVVARFVHQARHLPTVLNDLEL